MACILLILIQNTFAVGKLGRDQHMDYHVRKGLTVAEIERWLGPLFELRSGFSQAAVFRVPACGRHVETAPSGGLYFRRTSLDSAYEARCCACGNPRHGAGQQRMPAIFIGNQKKVFVIQVEPQMGAAIRMSLRQTSPMSGP